MTWNKYISPALMACLLSAGTTVLCGCSDDNISEDENGFQTGIPTTVGFSISSMRSNSSTTETDGDGTPADPTDENEMIKSWWIAFINKDGVVAEILDRPASATAAVELENFKCTIPSGSYDIYAFANIDRETLKTETGLDFKKGSKIDTDAVENAVWNNSQANSLNNWDPSQPIPMSGFLKGVKVNNTIEENFSIEVVRMVAKVEFRLENTGTQSITLNSISIDPAAKCVASLFPRGESGISYAHLGNYAYTPLASADYQKLTITLYSDNIVEGGKKLNKAFYIQESLSGRENDNAFTIGMNVSHDSGVSEFQQYNITRDILTYINRNDYIVIPVTLSRYDVKVEALFYPPIGGYPALTAGTDPEGAQIFTFGTQGNFEIAATVTDKQTGTHLAPAYYSISLPADKICDPAKIFSKTPTLYSTSPSMPDEVTGTLNANTGKATLELTVNIYDKPRYQTGARITNSYTRKIYIIRNNQPS
ncbi:MAG: hypothetical protein K2L89_03025 [Muribaculaceae bacterium]|nr:hypothetical protein [Muribaculaceae bacterium]